jgi:hypothetical protein
MSAKLKLKDVYITYGDHVRVVPKSKGKPPSDVTCIDCGKWTVASVAMIFLQQFTWLTSGLGFDPNTVYDEFDKIDEFRDLLELGEDALSSSVIASLTSPDLRGIANDRKPKRKKAA